MLKILLQAPMIPGGAGREGICWRLLRLRPRLTGRTAENSEARQMCKPPGCDSSPERPATTSGWGYLPHPEEAPNTWAWMGRANPSAQPDHHRSIR
jgi:hypothetical protein